MEGQDLWNPQTQAEVISNRKVKWSPAAHDLQVHRAPKFGQVYPFFQVRGWETNNLNRLGIKISLTDLCHLQINIEK